MNKNPYHPPLEASQNDARWVSVGRGAAAVACCVGSVSIAGSGLYRFFFWGGLTLVPSFSSSQLFWFGVWAMIHVVTASALAVCAFAILRRHHLMATLGCLSFCGACFAAWIFRMDFLGFNT